MTPHRADTEMEEEGRTGASGQDGRNTPERLRRSLEILHGGHGHTYTKYKWNDCVHKRIMSSCLKWNKARSRWNLIPRRTADRLDGRPDQHLLTTAF